MTPPSATIEEFPPARTAEEFIEQLRPTANRWEGDDPFFNRWIFRGQKDAGFKLLPTAFRKPDPGTLFFEYLQRIREKYEQAGYKDEDWINWAWPGNPHYTRNQADAASDGLVHGVMVRDFFILADRAGHRTERPPFLWHLEADEGHSAYLSQLVGGTLEPWEMEQFAIAQHHGIPTQLLDWSYNPLIAAYFAAHPLMRHAGPASTGSIAVWALRIEIFRRDWEELRRVTVPSTVVPFLDAQKGLFTWSPVAYRHYASTGAYPCVEDLVERIGASARCPAHWPRPFLRKLTLPKTEVPTLLRLLWREGVTVAHLMPTWDNVTESLKAKSFLEGA